MRKSGQLQQQSDLDSQGLQIWKNKIWNMNVQGMLNEMEWQKHKQKENFRNDRLTEKQAGRAHSFSGSSQMPLKQAGQTTHQTSR